MKTYTTKISEELHDNIITFSIRHNYSVFMGGGIVHDFYIVHTDKIVKIGKITPRKYAILYLKKSHTNNSSPYAMDRYLTVTDREETLKQYISRYTKLSYDEVMEELELSA